MSVSETFEEKVKWAREHIPRQELDKLAITMCLTCTDYGRCGNMENKDWCYIATTYAINEWRLPHE